MSGNAKPVPGPVPVADEPNQKTKERSKPTRTIPSVRINTAKQLDILRAYAAASVNGTKAANINEVAEIVKMAPTTVSTANAFLSSINLITRTEAGTYLPSPEVLAFLRAYEWNPDSASHKLAPLLKESWFGKMIVTRLTFSPMDESAAVTLLADEVSAGPEYQKELKMLLEFLASGGVILREGGQIRLAKQSDTESSTIATARVEESVERKESASPSAARLTTSVAAQPGKFNLAIAIEVDMAEFATWRPERIQAFFRGVAEVLAAKADVEKGGTPS
jgi:hypothetical protein